MGKTLRNKRRTRGTGTVRVNLSVSPEFAVLLREASDATETSAALLIERIATGPLQLIAKGQAKPPEDAKED